MADHLLSAFNAVVNTEVVEYVFGQCQWAAPAYASLNPGGVLKCSTPHHGYLKNCTLALNGKLDAHFTALTALLQEAGFQVVSFRGAGHWPWLF